MTESDARALVLVGPMGAGKTSIGRKVARTMGMPFTDTDKAIVRDHGPIAELFSTIGERAFRELERAAVAEAVSGGGVVALGGGAVLDVGTRALLGDHRVVLLTVSPQVVASRIAGTDRPLLNGDDDPVERWQRILAERSPLYDEVADVTFDTSSGPISDIVTAIVAWARSAEPGSAAENTKEQA